MPVFDKPGLKGGDCSVDSDILGDSANRPSVKGSMAVGLPVRLGLPMTRGALSMLTFRLGAADNDEGSCCCCCCSEVEDEIKGVCLGDVGEAALLLRVWAMDAATAGFVGDVGLCAGPPGPACRLLAMDRGGANLDVDGSADAETEAPIPGLDDVSGTPLAKKNLADDDGADSRFWLVVDMDVELDGGPLLRPPSAVAPLAYKNVLAGF